MLLQNQAKLALEIATSVTFPIPSHALMCVNTEVGDYICIKVNLFHLNSLRKGKNVTFSMFYFSSLKFGIYIPSVFMVCGNGIPN